jgi:hypothetical protein
MKVAMLKDSRGYQIFQPKKGKALGVRGILKIMGLG